MKIFGIIIIATMVSIYLFCATLFIIQSTPYISSVKNNKEIKKIETNKNAVEEEHGLFYPGDHGLFW